MMNNNNKKVENIYNYLLLRPNPCVLNYDKEDFAEILQRDTGAVRTDDIKTDII